MSKVKVLDWFQTCYNGIVYICTSVLNELQGLDERTHRNAILLVCMYYVDCKCPGKKYHKLNLFKSCYINNNASDRCLYPDAFTVLGILLDFNTFGIIPFNMVDFYYLK